jgi:hypothetical protein
MFLQLSLTQWKVNTLTVLLPLNRLARTASTKTDNRMSLQTYHHTTLLAGMLNSVFVGIRIYYFSYNPLEDL